MTDPFASGSASSLAFKTKGTKYTRLPVIEAPKLVHATDFATKKPAYWPDGNPKMTVVVKLDLNGEARSLWAPKPSALFSAIADAQRALGRAIQPGDLVTVEYTDDAPSKSGNPKKLYAATVEPPAAGPAFGAADNDEKPPF